MLPIFKSSYFQDLLESFPNGIAIFNTDGDVYACNSEVDTVLHTAGMGCTGRHWRDLLGGVEQQQELERFVNQVFDEQSCSLPLEVRYQRPEGLASRLSLTIGLLKDYGKIFGVVLSITDVTHIYALHEREKQVLDQINAIHQERAEHLRKLAMAVAHQIRNPVMTVGGFARLLLKRAGEGDQEFLEGILESGKRLESIVNAVSEFTSIVAGEARRIDIRKTLEEVRDKALACGPPGLVVLVEAELSWLWADPCLVSGALGELAVNAVEALGQEQEQGRGQRPAGQPRVVLRARAVADGWRELQVEDNGPGIAEEDMPFIFDPFFTTKAVGVGMGLTKARRMAGELGGELTISNQAGGGTLAVVRLPAEDVSSR